MWLAEVNQSISREDARFMKATDRSKVFIEEKYLLLLQILLGHVGTRVGGSAFVQSVAAGFGTQVNVFDL